MSALEYFYDPVPRTVYTDGSGRRVIREEHVGREGGTPPIFIVWNDFDSGELLGVYSRRSIDAEPKTWGPMFADAEGSASQGGGVGG